MMGYILPYIKLTKFFLSLAIAFSACVGFYLSDKGFNSQVPILFAGVFLLSAGASALNQLSEQNTDKLMSRTFPRPLPSGTITRRQAYFTVIFCISAGSLFLFTLSITALFLGWLNIVIYNFIYTPLKFKTDLALLPGGLVGAIPPLIGWFCAGENILSLQIISLVSFMFLWQIPHFIILNLKYRDDYEKAGIVTMAQSGNLENIKFLFLIWMVSANLASILFLKTGVISSQTSGLFLIVLNISALVFFGRMIFNQIENLRFHGNFYFLLYLLLNFLLVLGDKLL